MFVVRPVARDDLPAVLALSERTGTGLTTLPASRDRLAGRIERSIASFAGTADRADACYVFVLVDAGAGNSLDRVVGIGAIEAAVGLKEPWYNYRVGTLVHASRALDVYTPVPTLFLANDHTGHTELCTLFVDQAYRRGRNGPLISKSRLLFMAEFPDRFGEKVIAELRGRLDAQGRSPFWEGLGRRFFAMEYSTADYLTGHRAEVVHRRADAAPPGLRQPAAADAREAIGAVHADTEPARRMLEQEGFRYEGYVDIFDAGPTLEAFRDTIDAVRRSRVIAVRRGRRRSRARHAGAARALARVEPALRRLPRDRGRGAGARGRAAAHPAGRATARREGRRPGAGGAAQARGSMRTT